MNISKKLFLSMLVCFFSVLAPSEANPGKQKETYPFCFKTKGLIGIGKNVSSFGSCDEINRFGYYERAMPAKDVIFAYDRRGEKYDGVVKVGGEWREFDSCLDPEKRVVFMLKEDAKPLSVREATARVKALSSNRYENTDYVVSVFLLLLTTFVKYAAYKNKKRFPQRVQEAYDDLLTAIKSLPLENAWRTKQWPEDKNQFLSAIKQYEKEHGLPGKISKEYKHYVFLRNERLQKLGGFLIDTFFYASIFNAIAQYLSYRKRARFIAGIETKFFGGGSGRLLGGGGVVQNPQLLRLAAMKRPRLGSES